MGRGPVPLDHPAFEVAKIGNLKAYACSYTKNNSRFAITLYGDSESNVLENNCDSLVDLKVDGEVDSEIPVNEEEAWAIIDAYERTNK